MGSDIYTWMKQNLPRGPFILEIGAHHAEDSERFFQMFPTAHIIAWEPDPRNIPVIRRKRMRNFLLVEAAVGAVDGTTTFYLSGGRPAGATGADRGRDWTYSSSIHRPKEHLTAHPSVKFVGEATVPIMRLDTWFEKAKGYRPWGQGSIEPAHHPIDFIWADVQGAEHDLIEGARQTLKRVRWLFTEVDNKELYEGQKKEAEVIAMLPEFDLVGHFENNILLRNRSL